VSIDEAYNFRRASDRVTTSGFVTDEQVKDLKVKGYGAVINLLPDGHDLALVGEADIVHDEGLDYVYLPVDFHAPTRGDFEAFVAAMDALEGQRIHVHCAANYRVSAFYSLYAQHKGWWSGIQADEFVRGIWDLTDHPAWEAFMTDARPRPHGRDGS
jgi:protein tyrosine phosphatase (PTP) superfamily phosphohydrolase (DUF442 family)